MATSRAYSPRYRMFSCVVYDIDKLTDNFGFVEKYSRIQGILCSPLHNNDFYADGRPKEPHYHLIVYMVRPLTFSGAVYELESYVTNGNAFVEPCNAPLKMKEYFTHKNDIDKAQYCADDILPFGDVEPIERACIPTKDENLMFLNDLLSLSPYEMARKYGRDYIRNMNKYEDFADMFRTKETVQFDTDREMHLRFQNWLRIYHPPFDKANLKAFAEFEEINGKFEALI